MSLNHIIKVLIVDNSLFLRTVLQDALLKNQGISAADTVGSAAKVARKIQEPPPDVVTIDVEIPDMKGTNFLRRLAPRRPVPVVLVSSLDLSIFDALDAGTIDFIRKSTTRTNYNLFLAELVTKTRTASITKVRAKVPSPLDSPSTPAPSFNSKGEKIIAIGTSTGGTEATLGILEKFPANIPGVLVVQYMPSRLTKIYAERLDRLCSFSAAGAQGGERAGPGRTYTASGDKHMTLAKDSRGCYIKYVADGKVSGHCPSVDVLLRPVAETAGKDAAGIILTGMSSDEAGGLFEMGKQGSFAVGQDKTSCVVYDMLVAASDIGVVVRQVPCPSTAGIITQHLNQAK